MKFDRGIEKKYCQSVEDAFATIMAKGNDDHRHVMNEILESDLLIRVKPVSEINASGITSVINSIKTNYKLATERLSLREALGEIYIAIAKETIDTGGQRGCEGTFVHEGRHAYDFAQTLESLSNKDMNPIGIFNPTLYELEWEAHKTAGDYMLCIDKPEYVDEGLQLMILCRNDSGGPCTVSDDGIMQRLNQSYGLDLKGNPGSLATEMMGIVV
ncbi:MAG: hypothetical protein ABL999_09730 [Pyrinomonadaceae bacterium]